MNETSIRHQRWLSNINFLCQLVSKNIDTFREAHGWAITAIKKLCREFDPSTDINDFELKAYINEARGGAPARSRGEWVWNEDSLKRQIRFEIQSLSSHAQEVLKKLEQEDVLRLFMLSYLNRKVCIMAENVLAANENLNDRNTNYRLFKLFENCQRVRCSDFSTPFRDYLSNERADREEMSFSELRSAYARKQRQPNCPFNKSLHRLRDPRSSAPIDVHPESKALALNAGAELLKLNEKESTLGLLEHVLGLPERCDISGTTTDAIGMAITLPIIYEFPRYRDLESLTSLYVLACMTAMSLAGHHSLSETATAASLWAGVNYKPFDPISLVTILNSLYDVNGEGCRGNPIVFDDDSIGWTRAKWKSLKLNKYAKDDIEFNDDLWYMSNVLIHGSL